MESIAKRVIEGEKTSRKELKNLAYAYLKLLQEFNRLIENYTNLLGGQIVTLHAYKDYNIRDSRVRTFKKTDGTFSTAVNKQANRLNKILSEHVEFATFGDGISLRGAENQLKKYLEICNLINEIQQIAYEIGLRDGKSLLVGLNDGTVSLAQL